MQNIMTVQHIFLAIQKDFLWTWLVLQTHLSWEVKFLQILKAIYFRHLYMTIHHHNNQMYLYHFY